MEFIFLKYRKLKNVQICNIACPLDSNAANRYKCIIVFFPNQQENNDMLVYGFWKPFFFLKNLENIVNNKFRGQ